jgi:WD40 repeat protein
VTAALDPTGRVLAVGGYDRAVELWDPLTGRHLRHLGTFPAAVRRLAFSPDGTQLAVGTIDPAGAVRVVDVADGSGAATLTGLNTDVNGLAWSLDGGLLGAASSGGVLALWPMQPADAVTAICQAVRGPDLATEWHALGLPAASLPAECRRTT